MTLLRHVAARIVCIFACFLVLTLIITVHEGGHFLACKLTGTYVERFQIGVGPALIKGRFGETEMVLCPFLFGGANFVRMEHPEEEIQGVREYPELRTFSEQSRPIRFIIVVAGVAANLLAYLLACPLVIRLQQFPSVRDALLERYIHRLGDRAFFQSRWLQRSIAGPIWISSFWSAQLTRGWRAVLNMWTRVNMILAIANLLPVPPLDGARLIDIMFFNSRWNGGGTEHWIAALLLIPFALGLIVFIVWLLIGDVARAARFELLLYHAQPDLKKIRDQGYTAEILEL